MRRHRSSVTDFERTARIPNQETRKRGAFKVQRPSNSNPEESLVLATAGPRINARLDSSSDWILAACGGEFFLNDLGNRRNASRSKKSGAYTHQDTTT